MKRRSTIYSAPLWCLSLYCLLWSCGDATTIGTDLFADEEINVSFTDTISIMAKSVLTDTVKTYDPQESTSQSLLLGNLDDPIFGQTSASIVTMVRIPNTPPDVPIRGIQLDSVVLSLELNSLFNYGDTLDNTISLDIFRVTENLGDIGEVYAGDDVMFDPEPIGSITDLRLNFDSLNVYNPLVDSIVTETPQIRIPFTDSFEEEFVTIARESQSDTTLVNMFNGLLIRPTDDAGRSTTVNINSTVNNSRLLMYYSIEDSLVLYSYSLFGAQFNLYERDVTDAAFVDQLDDYDIGDDRLYLKGNVGTQIEVDISNIRQLDGLLINSVEFECTIVEDNVTNVDVYSPIPNILCSYYNDEGILVEITDLQDAIVLGNGFNIEVVELFFGGNVTDNTNLNTRTYKMNMTKYIKDILSTDEDIKPIIITPAFNSFIPQRSVIYGPGHELYPMKLNVTYTL